MIESEGPSVQIRIWLLGPFLLERRTGAGIWEPIAKKVWNKRGYAYPLLQRLLCTHNRRAERITLIDDFWPNPDKPELLDRYINDAAYYLRKVLAIPDAVKTFGNASGYQLADQSMIWIDVDACDELLKEAERLGCTSSAALPLLEQASRYLQRGAFLEQQMGQWAYARRGSVERMNYRCHLWLAEAYEQHDLPGQAETLYNHLLEDDPTDEDILRRLMRLYHQQGMKQLARKCYEDTRQRLHHLKQSFSPDLQAFAQHLLSEPSTVELYKIHEIATAPLLILGGQHKEILSLSSQTHSIINAGEEQEQEGRNNTDMLRRQILQYLLGTISTAFTLPTEEILHQLEPLLLHYALGDIRKSPTVSMHEFLSQCEASVKACWHLMRGKGLAVVEEILLAYTPPLLSLAAHPSPYQHKAACIATEVNFLQAVIAKHRLNFRGRELYCLEAIQCSRIAEDSILEAASLMYLAYTYIYCSPLHPERAVNTFLEALQLLSTNAPLLRSDIYIGLADAYAMCKEDQKAFACINHALDCFPSQAEHDTSYLYADCSLQVIYQYEGKMYLDLAEHNASRKYYEKAQDVLANSTKISFLSDRSCNETLLYQADVARGLGNLEEFVSYLDRGIQTAVELGSEQRYQQALEIYQRIPEKWQLEAKIQELADETFRKYGRSIPR